MIEIEEQEIIKNLFDKNKALNLLKLCLQDDGYFYYFYDKIDTFSTYNDKLFEQFFKGNYDYCKPYTFLVDINQRYNYELLLRKIEDFQSIICEWYKDESKHPLIKGLWEKKLCIGLLKNKTYEELDEIFNEIIDKNSIYITNKEEIKIELKNLINDSPETEASNIAIYLKKNFEDFYSLIEISQNYKDRIEKSKTDEDKTIQDKLEDFIKKIIKDILPNIQDKIPKALSEKLKNNEGFANLFAKHIGKNISGNDYFNNDIINYKTISNLVYKFRNGIEILRGLRDYYGNPLFIIPQAAMLFLNLCTSIKSFYQSLVDYKQKKTKFTNRLAQIHQNFEEHKREIRKIDLQHPDMAIEIIIDIGIKINGDKNDVIQLMIEIENEIENAKKKKKSSGKKIAGGVLGFLSSVLGFAVTGGGIAVLYIAFAGVSSILIGINSADVVVQKKAIKNYINLLKQANDQYTEIQNELNNLKNLYENANIGYIPVNL